MYVNDCIIIQRKGSSSAENLVRALKEGPENFDSIDDGDLDKYLGVDVNKNKNGEVELTQIHLISRFLDIIGLDKKVNPRPTPAIKP